MSFCPDCGPSAFVVVCDSAGDTTCTECGLVLGERMILQDYDNNKSWCFDTHTAPNVVADAYAPSHATAATVSGAVPVANHTCHKLLDRALTQLHLNETNVDKLAKRLWAENARRCDARNSSAIACCIYKACMMMNSEKTPRAAKEICRVLVVDFKQFVKTWKTWGDASLLVDSSFASTSASASASASTSASASASASPPVHVAKLPPRPAPQSTKARDCIIRQLHQIPEVKVADIYTLANQVAALDAERKAQKQMIASPPLIVNSVLICLAMKRYHGRSADITKIKKSIADLGFASMSSLTKYVRDVGKALGI